MKSKLILPTATALAVGFSAWLGRTQANSETPEKPVYPIQIYVGPGTEVRVTVPNIAKADLVDIISTFFSKGDEKAKTNFNAVIGKSSAVTFVLTTKTP